VTACLIKKKGKKDYLNKNIIITSNQEPTNDDSNIIKANYKNSNEILTSSSYVESLSYMRPFLSKGGGLKVLNNLKLQITAIEMGLVHLRSINL